MNTAEMDTYTNNATSPGVKAPITRIGGGELRVNRALASPIAVWDAAGQSGSLSFGFVDGHVNRNLTKTLTIRNYSAKTLTYAIKPSFRYSNDKNNGAVSFVAPTSITLKPHQTKSFNVTLKVNASKLRPWTLNANDQAMDPTQLDLLEYDGYIKFDRKNYSSDDADPVHVAWEVLPRQAADVASLDGNTFTGGDTIGLKNNGAGLGAVDVYSLVGTSPQKPASRPGMNAPVIDLKSVGVQTFDSACYSDTNDFVYSIAINQFGRPAVAPVPAEFDVNINTDNDPEPEYTVFTGTVSGSLTDIRLLTYVYDWATDDVTAEFYASNSTNDPTTILTFCGYQVGMTTDDYGSPMTMDVMAYDWYFRDYALTDSIDGIEVAPYAEHYGWSDWSGDVVGAYGDIVPGGTADLTIADWSEDYMYPVNPSETGLLLVTNASREDYYGAAPRNRETIQLLAEEN
jgi:minor extracellular serine protease Vpr